MLQFIPVTDDYLEHDPTLYLRLVPFNLDYPCRRLELEPVGKPSNSSQISAHQGESHE